MDELKLLQDLIKGKENDVKIQQAKLDESLEELNSFKKTEKALLQRMSVYKTAGENVASHSSKDDRYNTIIQILKDAGGEANVRKIATPLNLHFESVRSWMNARIKKEGASCAWEPGKNNYHFRLKERFMHNS